MSAPRRRGQPPRRPAAPAESARSVALRCLRRIEHEGAYANIVTPAELERSSLSDRDRRFVTDLVYGTTRMRRACDALLGRFLVSEPEPEVRTVLRLGAYQIAYAGVAPHAAVSATVDLAPRRASGFVNAVLRKVAAVPMGDDLWASPAERLSMPDWVFDRYVAECGLDDALASLATMNLPAAATERADGYVQDIGSQWVAAAVPCAAGDLALDVCAAPGGKSTAMAARGATVVAADLQPQRVGLVAANAARLGATGVLPVVADALHGPWADGSFDHVLLDAPCSGLGTLRRRADARWRVAADDVASLAELQRQMLLAAAPLVRPGGT
ncbi:MAG: hypothetical protein RJB65_1285, partial [Actinomycetota bacterium]